MKSEEKSTTKIILTMATCILALVCAAALLVPLAAAGSYSANLRHQGAGPSSTNESILNGTGASHVSRVVNRWEPDTEAKEPHAGHGKAPKQPREMLPQDMYRLNVPNQADRDHSMNLHLQQAEMKKAVYLLETARQGNVLNKNSEERQRESELQPIPSGTTIANGTAGSRVRHMVDQRIPDTEPSEPGGDKPPTKPQQMLPKDNARLIAPNRHGGVTPSHRRYAPPVSVSTDGQAANIVSKYKQALESDRTAMMLHPRPGSRVAPWMEDATNNDGDKKRRGPEAASKGASDLPATPAATGLSLKPMHGECCS